MKERSYNVPSVVALLQLVVARGVRCLEDEEWATTLQAALALMGFTVEEAKLRCVVGEKGPPLYNAIHLRRSDLRACLRGMTEADWEALASLIRSRPTRQWESERKER